MSFKRTAGSELNRDNWDEEDEGEEVGEFKKAAEDILQQRVRKVARRRAVPNDGNSQVLNPFSGFGGFGGASSSFATAAASTPNVTAASTPFSFLSKIPSAPITTKTNGEIKLNDNSSTATTKSSTNTEYFGKVKSLNIAFADWIKTHVNDNPLVDLTPVFKDYEKYLKEFNELKQKTASSSSSSSLATNDEKKDTQVNTTSAPEAPKISPNFTFGKPASTSTNIFSSVNPTSIFSSSNTSTLKDASPVKTTLTENKGFSFGSVTSSQANNSLTSTPSFSFGLQKTSTTLPGAPPLFGSLAASASTPFSFANVTQTASESASKDAPKADGEAEDEEPPKNDFVPVVEEDSLFSKRCKVFVKTGADYADRGIGTLYLKKVDDKVQAVVRADTNLGNILFNIILQEGLPTSRLGKNNVMIVCLPTPESKPPPTPVLIRVKTSVEADELLAIIEKYKKI